MRWDAIKLVFAAPGPSLSLKFDEVDLGSGYLDFDRWKRARLPEKAFWLLSTFIQAAPKYTNQQVPNFADGENAELVRLRDLNGYRYMEFFLVGSEPYEDKIMGACYNTTGRNTKPADPKDSAPPALVEKLDPVQLAKQYGVPHIYINPPRQWLLDWVDIPIGATRDFGGIEAHRCAVMAMPKGEWKPHRALLSRLQDFFQRNCCWSE